MKRVKNRIKCTKDCLIVFWLSIFAMILISGIEGNSNAKPELIPDDSIILYDFPPQDTLRKATSFKADSIKRLNGKMQKQLEYEQYQKRSQKIDEDMMRMNKQSQMMDSLLGKTDTTRIER